MAIKDTRLLPNNASDLEFALDQSGFDPVEILESKAIELTSAKFEDIPDSFLPWLVFEYGLEEVVPWVMDEREALRTGLQWQRVRGTPESLRIAMSWIDFEAIQIEQAATGGRHYFEYQLEIDDVPSDELVENLIELCTLSAPIRSRLARVYNEEYDVRPFILDESDWGDLLDDYSGVHGPDGVRLSFGRFSSFYAESPADDHVAIATGKLWGFHAESAQPSIAIGRMSFRGTTVDYTGQYWTGVTWMVPETWESLTTAVGLSFKKFISPEKVFLDGAEGAFFLPRPETAYLTDAGITNAGDTDPVGMVEDESGGDHHATQATSGSRPTLNQDADGRWYLQCDGSTFLQIAHDSVFNFSSIGGVYIALAVATESGSATYFLAKRDASPVNSGTAGSPGWVFGDNGSAYKVWVDDGSTIRQPNSSFSVDSDPHVYVYTGEPGDPRYRVDGVDQGAASEQAGDNMVDVELGNSDSGTPLKIYAAVVCTPVPSESDRIEIERYLADTIGKVL